MRITRFLPASICLFVTLPVAIHAQEPVGKITDLAPSPETNPDITPMTLSLPAPRGRILDRTGRILADTRVFKQVTLAVPELEATAPVVFISKIRQALAALPESLIPYASNPTDEELETHFKERLRMPFNLTKPFDPEKEEGADLALKIPGTGLKSVYYRVYPAGRIGAHTIGHMGNSDETISGPVRQGESYWQPLKGIAGLEGKFEETLKGSPGSLILAVNGKKGSVETEILRAPVAGNDLAISMDLPTQEAVESALRKAERPGAVVIMDANSGDILASASFPGYDPSLFIPAISAEDYGKLTKDPSGALFNRAFSASYPPGSTFKPLVGLAALSSGAISPYQTFHCEPTLEIDGRTFRNWSEDERGEFDLRAALIRSHNSWFYQAAMVTRDEPILRFAEAFGFGKTPDIPVSQVASGSLPEKVPSNQGLANLSIGQGEVTASPLQVARMMAAFCNARILPSPRLVLQTQTRHSEVVDPQPPTGATLFSRETPEMRYVRNGLYAVVNHERGTGAKARMENVSVCGKTGTSQWSDEGKASTMVWFAGFVSDSVPPISFAVALEGKPGEKIFGGSHAAPLAGEILKAIFSSKSGSYIKPRSSENSSVQQADAMETMDTNQPLDQADLGGAGNAPGAPGAPGTEENPLKAIPVEPGGQ